MASPPLCHVSNIYGFISTSIKPITTKLHRKRPACSALTLNVMMTSFQLVHMASVYGFISTVVSSITTKSGRIANQHALNIPRSDDGVITTRSHG